MKSLLTAKVDSVARPQNKVRKISGLKWVELSDSGPFPVVKPRKKSQKVGLAYEKKVGRKLKRMLKEGELSGDLNLSQWLFFTDINGLGWAQPDAYLLMENRILLNQTPLKRADRKIDGLRC